MHRLEECEIGSRTGETAVDTLKPAEFADIARDLFDENGLDDTLHKVLEHACDVTHGDDSSVVLFRARHQLEPAAWSHARAEAADELQNRLSEGPVVSVASSHETVLVPDTDQDDRWPTWGPLAADLGLHGVVSTCLYTGKRTLGTLNIYASRAGALGADDAERARALGGHAAVAIDAASEEAGLRRAVETRSLIGQAQGLLMERYGLDARRAFDVLRRYSQETNTKLRDVAEHLVINRELPDLG